MTVSRSREWGWAPLNLLLPNLPDSSVPVTRPIYQSPAELRRKTDQLQNIAKCKIKKKVVSNACLCYYTTIHHNRQGFDLQNSWTPFPKFPVRSYLYYLTICVKYAKETKCIKGKGVHWKTERQPPSVVPILHGDPHNHEATQGAGGLTGDIFYKCFYTLHFQLTWAPWPLGWSSYWERATRQTMWRQSRSQIYWFWNVSYNVYKGPRWSV